MRSGLKPKICSSVGEVGVCWFVFCLSIEPWGWSEVCQNTYCMRIFAAWRACWPKNAELEAQQVPDWHNVAVR
jgi:hypothetical protein